MAKSGNVGMSRFLCIRCARLLCLRIEFQPETREVVGENFPETFHKTLNKQVARILLYNDLVVIFLQFNQGPSCTSIRTLEIFPLTI